VKSEEELRERLAEHIKKDNELFDEAWREKDRDKFTLWMVEHMSARLLRWILEEDDLE
jgi:hypothetical protein